jgi:glucose/arabinose dehydrogenase
MKKTLGLLCALTAVGLSWQQGIVKLPAPNATPSVSNGPKIVPRPEGAEIKVPAGFVVEEFASGFARPRYMALGPSGEVLLSDFVQNGAVWVLNGTDRKKLVEGLDRPYGIAFWKEYVYITEATAVKRYRYDAKAMTVGAAEEIIPLKGFDKGHFTRTLAFDRAGKKLYVAIGSSGNVVTGDPESRAAINRYNPDGTGHEVVAGGLRNPLGIRFYPGTDDLWTTVQERDGLGDELVPDFFTKVRQGGFYGWPYSYTGSNIEPRIKEERKDLVDRAIVPDVLLPPHMAVMDFLFYEGKQFPAEYRNGAFLASHGSNNRSTRLGYNIGFIPFKGGKPAGPMRDFASGLMMAPDKQEVWGRPVGLVTMKDGSLLLSEDGNKKVYRIAYKK